MVSRSASVAWYISGHGFGHASREIEIINALGPRLPDGCEILIRTSAARWLFERRSEEHTSELQSQSNLVCRLLLEKKKHTRVDAHSSAIAATDRLPKRP